MVPKSIKDGYGEKLRLLNKIEVIGKQWFIFYNYNRGYVSNLGAMLDCFKVVVNETIVFTIDQGSVLRARIYQIDGKEIDYTSRMTGVESKKNGT